MCWIWYVNCMYNILIFMDTYTVRITHLIPIMFYFVTPFECQSFVFIIPMEFSIVFTKMQFYCQQQQQHTTNNTIEAMNELYKQKELSSKKINKIEPQNNLALKILIFFLLNSIHLFLFFSLFFSLSHQNIIMISQMVLFFERQRADMNMNTVWYDNYKVYTRINGAHSNKKLIAKKLLFKNFQTQAKACEQKWNRDREHSYVVYKMNEMKFQRFCLMIHVCWAAKNKKPIAENCVNKLIDKWWIW